MVFRAELSLLNSRSAVSLATLRLFCVISLLSLLYKTSGYESSESYVGDSMLMQDQPFMWYVCCMLILIGIDSAS